MSELPLHKKPKRLASLDAFRGITIAMMILVNNPGTWSKIYPPLSHAEWHGWTFTDLIFPFFLYIVGVAIVLAFTKRLKQGVPKKELYLKILRRTVLLLGIGLFLNGFAGLPDLAWIIYAVLFLLTFIGYVILNNLFTGQKAKTLFHLKRFFQLIVIIFIIHSLFYFNFANLRIPGVLQRIAVCYAIASIIVLNTDIKWQAYITFGILIVYWIMMKTIPVPGYGAGVLQPEGNLCWYIDSKLLAGHTWSHAPAKGFDPEGILSTLPAVSTVLMGILTGHWLKTDKGDYEKVSGMFVAGIFGLLSGIIVDIWFPINKNLWSSSYVLFMAGMALLFLATLYWLVDIYDYKSYTKPFIMFGSNAIIMFSLSSFFAKALGLLWKINLPDGTTMTLKNYLYQNLFASWLSPINASLAYAISYLLIWFMVAYILYRKRIYIKV
jgi:predicted acyltransferase